MMQGMATVDREWPAELHAAVLRDQGYSAEHILRVTGCDVHLVDPDVLAAAASSPLSGAEREQARALRREGANLPEIAAELQISRSTAYNWTLGVVDQRPTAARERRARRIEEARGLRAQGVSYKKIAARLGVSPATAHGWTKGVPLPDGMTQAVGRTPEELREINLARWAAQHAVAEQERAAVWRAAADVVSGLVDRDLLLLGAVAYWCEGSKAKPWAPRREQVTLVNSDPMVIRLFLRFLDAAGIARQQVQYRLSIHETADVSAAQAHWATIVDVPAETFMRANIKKHKPLTQRKNTGEHYRGCLVLQVRDGRRLYWLIDGIMKALDQASQKGVLNTPDSGMC